ncbi:MAG: rod-binding protein [Bdellovibrionota bacterium]
MLKGISPSAQSPEQQQSAIIDKRDPKVLEAAKMYEQVFLKQMVDAMRQAVPKSELVNESMGERIYKDQMYDNYVEQWSNVGGVGLGDMIYDQIIERFGPQQKQIKPMGPMPMNSGKTFEIENKSEGQTGSGHEVMLLKFKPQNNFEPMQITSPFEGEIIGSNTLENGQKALFLKHPNDMKSTFVFNGSLNLTKNNFGPGEHIGTVSPESNEFLWKLEGKKV